LETQSGSVKTYSKEARYEGECWVHLRQDKVQWRDGVDTSTNINRLFYVLLTVHLSIIFVNKPN